MYLDEEGPWYVFAASGRDAKMDSKRLYVVHRDYEKLRRERELELRLFPEEVIQSVIEYFEKNSEDLRKSSKRLGDGI